jgi:hypothetical protein
MCTAEPNAIASVSSPFIVFATYWAWKLCGLFASTDSELLLNASIS